MSEKTPITEADLQAYVDSRLPEARCADIEAYLAARPDEAARMQVYRQQKEALRRLFDPVLDEPLPERLQSLASGPTWQRWFTSPALRIAAAAAWLGLGAVLGWYVNDNTKHDNVLGSNAKPFVAAVESPTLARRAMLAHVTFVPEKRHPVEVGADQEAHLVEWLSKRLGKPVRVPTLVEQGYALVGGRLLPGDDNPAAQFMYEDPRGARLTLYVKTKTNNPDGDSAFRYSQEKGVSVFYWIDGDFGYALSGSIDKPRLLEVAKAVYHQIKL